MGIHDAKKAKEVLAGVMNQEYPDLQAKVKIIFHNKELALEMTIAKKSDQKWVEKYHGLPLIVKTALNQF